MPGGDGTGPAGRGPMTGRAAGSCAGYPVPGYADLIGGRGFGGRGRGFGRGRAGYGWPAWGSYPMGHSAGFGPAPNPEQEEAALRQQSQDLQGSLDAINKRIEDLEQEKPK